MNTDLSLGRLLALSAAVSYGTITTIAAILYQEGANPTSVAVLRFGLMTLAMFALVILLSRPFRIDVSIPRLMLLITAWYLVTLGHLGAVNYIPVSLAAAIFYTFPLMVLAYERFIKRTKVSPREVGGFMLAFIGLIIALGPVFTQLNPIGITLAFIAAVSAATFLLSYESIPKSVDVISISFWLALGGTALAMIVALLDTEIIVPDSSRAIKALIAMAVLTTLAFILNLSAIRRIGAASTSLLLNIEPIVIMGAAAILVDEQLSLKQILGITIVVIGLIISQWQSQLRNPQEQVV